MQTPEQKVVKELWEGCGEQLEHARLTYIKQYKRPPPLNYWDQFVIPVLIRLVVKEREQNEILRKRMDYVRGNTN